MPTIPILTDLLANAVARIDNLEFLSDVIPKTVPYKQFVKESKKAKEGGHHDLVEKGQMTLDGKHRARNGYGGDAAQDEDGTDEDEAAALQLQGQPMDMEIRGGRSNGAKSARYPNGYGERDEDEDATMD